MNFEGKTERKVGFKLVVGVPNWEITLLIVVVVVVGVVVVVVVVVVVGVVVVAARNRKILNIFDHNCFVVLVIVFVDTVGTFSMISI